MLLHPDRYRLPDKAYPILRKLRCKRRALHTLQSHTTWRHALGSCATCRRCAVLAHRRRAVFPRWPGRHLPRGAHLLSGHAGSRGFYIWPRNGGGVPGCRVLHDAQRGVLILRIQRLMLIKLSVSSFSCVRSGVSDVADYYIKTSGEAYWTVASSVFHSVVSQHRAPACRKTACNIWRRSARLLLRASWRRKRPHLTRANPIPVQIMAKRVV